MDYNKECLQALKDGNLFDWIGIHGYDMNKDELIRIIKEFSYVVRCSKNSASMEALVYESIQEFWDLI